MSDPKPLHAPLDKGPCACGRFKSYPANLPPLTDGRFHLQAGEADLCEIATLLARVAALTTLLRDVVTTWDECDAWTGEHLGRFAYAMDNARAALASEPGPTKEEA